MLVATSTTSGHLHTIETSHLKLPPLWARWEILGQKLGGLGARRRHVASMSQGGIDGLVHRRNGLRPSFGGAIMSVARRRRDLHALGRGR